ncbi:MAG: NAD(P)/FAD-dependent oxidoreductase [Gammaproteobacteria bacterium]|jgi:monoamine oxidase
MPERHDVIVIGAGLAGLHAALLLQESGHDVIVVEAQQRSGGRIHSMRQLGSNAEAGGTFIGAGYRRVFAIAERFGIRLIDVTPLLEFFREQDLCLGDEIIRQADWPTHPRNPFPENDREIMPWNFHRVLTMRENPLPEPGAWLDPEYARYDISMREWMLSLGLDERTVSLGYDINSSFGTDASDVSALLLLLRGAFSKAQRKDAPEGVIGFTVENGVQRLPDAMAQALYEPVRFDHAVNAIEQDASGIEVHCANGRRLRAAHVICTLPPGVLRNVAMQPGIEPRQQLAIATIPSQPVTQIYLAPKKAFWHDDGYAASLFTDSKAGMVAAVRDGTDPSRITHLTAWIMGPHAAALDRLTPEAAAQAVIAEIERLRPAAKGQLEWLGQQSWGTDPHAGGAWVYFRPGQIREFAGLLGRAHGRLHFAGEHLAASARGMEGALESAEAAVAALA